MEKSVKPLNIYIKRKRGLTAFAGVLWLAAAGGALALLYAVLIDHVPSDTVIAVTVGMYLWAFVFLVISALCIRNLFYEFVLTADESGINDYSGFLHLGRIAWQDIRSITLGSGNKAVDVFNGEIPSITLNIRDIKQYTKKLGIVKKAEFILYGASIKIRTLCASVKKREILALLFEMHRYYSQLNDSLTVSDNIARGEFNG